MRKLLLPFAWLYGGIILIRNYFYDKGWSRSLEFDFPIILVGNLSSGGTGKTPHVEYLLRLLMPDYKMATLSRGYKRKMRGYGLATELSLVEDIGDEPKLYKQKYPDVEVAVSEKRVIGIYYLLNDEPEVRAVILDDGLQHRKIKAGLNILLTPYNNLFTEDMMLPAGNLREPASGKKRAHCFIITKCAATISESEKREVIEKIKPTTEQPVFFTTQVYGKLYPLFEDQKLTVLSGNEETILLTGIAGNSSIEKYVKANTKHIRTVSYGDHHYYSNDNLKYLQLKSTANSIIITTEKDAMRLMEKKDIIIEMGLSIFVLPIEVQFIDKKIEFDTMIKLFIDKFGMNAIRPE